jgi:uncharacterized membrane protein
MKKLNRPIYRLFDRELQSHVNKGIINKDQKDDMMAFYQEGFGLSFIRVLVTVGAIILGLGIILFIASNWDDMSRFFKILIIVSGIAASLFTSFKLEKDYPKTGEAFLYLSTILYGSGIFLIQQMYNISDPQTYAFLLWGMGSLGMAMLFKKTLLFIFAQALALLFLSVNFENNIIIIGILTSAAFYYTNKFFKFKQFNTFVTNSFVLLFILNVLYFFDVDGIYNSFIFLGLGLLMYYLKHDLNLEVFKITGLITIGIGGFALSFNELWEQLPFIQNGDIYSISFGILFIVYLLSLVEKKQIIPLVWTCIMITRYYFDSLYDFLPKSLFFIIGGAMLLGFGYYIERFRKGGLEDEKLS